jgi:hypothetical protein
MKRSVSPLRTTNGSSTTTTLQGYVIGVSNITKNESNSNYHYTLTMEGSNGNAITVMRYLSANATCRLHTQLRLLIISQRGIELTNIRSNASSYSFTNDTRLTETDLPFLAQWNIVEDILHLKRNAEERLCAIRCKILNVADPQAFVVVAGYKRTQKLRKEIIVADQTSAVILNIYEPHFDSILTSGLSYKITGLKTRLFKDIISLSAITETKYVKCLYIHLCLNYNNDKLCGFDHSNTKRAFTA